jgi:hypothetical protein
MKCSRSFFVELKGNWKDSNDCRLGLVDWASEILVRVDNCYYTCNIATIAVGETKLKNFKHNIIDLGVFHFIHPVLHSNLT